MSKFVSRMAFLLGLVIFAIGLMSCPIGDSGTDPDPNPSPKVEISSVSLQPYPAKTRYLWGEDFTPKGMGITITFKDGTEDKTILFTEADQFLPTVPPSNSITLTKEGYTFDLYGFVNDQGGPGDPDTNISVTLGVRAADDSPEKGKSVQFNVNIFALNKIVVDTKGFVPHFYLGQALPVGNDAIIAMGLKVQGQFAGGNAQDLPEKMKIAVQLEANGSGYADIGGKQKLKVIVEGLPLTDEQAPAPIDITVHIHDDAPNQTYASGKEYKVEYKDMALIAATTIPKGSGIGDGPFKESKLKDKDLSISSFELGQYEVTYELWYAVYKWATMKEKENLYVFSNNEGLGILTSGGAAGSLPTDDGNDKYMPVHGINWSDAIVWCNAYYELLCQIAGVNITKSVYPYLLSGEPIKDVKTFTAENLALSTSSSAYRLPSETEWELAVRGGTVNSGPWLNTYAGNNKVDLAAWYDDNSDKRAHSPNESDGLKEPVQIGNGKLYNMSGNVWEWCQSDDSGTEVKPYYLKRGGAYHNADEYCSNNTGRVITNPTDTVGDTGFRLARTSN